MMKSLAFPTSVLLGAVALVACLPAHAQTSKAVGETAAPDYGSGSSSLLPDGSFNTPASDGRPGLYYFDLGAQAFKKGDYRHAVDMYKVAASWAYKPAEYNLGLMYFRGQGVATDRARGAAWMVLAAERGIPLYVKARDLMITALSKAEFQRTDEVWNQLKPTYGDAVALRRAKARWAQVKSATTGSRLGAAASEHLMVGGSGSESPNIHGSNPGTGAIGVPTPVTGWGVFKGAAITDGSVAYRQFQQSDDPYDPVFMKDRTGTVTVEPMQQIKSRTSGHSSQGKPATASSTQSPRNA